MVYLTGNNIVSGTSDNFYNRPQQILEEDIVFVTVQFRVGFLGFLSTGTEDAPGNNGILDCIEALRWVKRYISHFGGDPDQVTLIGNHHSAAIAHILTITPLIVHLFLYVYNRVAKLIQNFRQMKKNYSQKLFINRDQLL